MGAMCRDDAGGYAAGFKFCPGVGRLMTLLLDGQKVFGKTLKVTAKAAGAELTV